MVTLLHITRVYDLRRLETVVPLVQDLLSIAVYLNDTVFKACGDKQQASAIFLNGELCLAPALAVHDMKHIFHSAGSPDQFVLQLEGL